MTYSQLQALIDDNLQTGSNIPAVKHREVEHALLDYIQANLFQTGDIKTVSCDLTYLNANFETNGLGKNLRLGWAICNGAKHGTITTPNIQGRTIIGYGTESGKSYALGQTGGSKDAVIVDHNHNYTIPLDGQGSGAGNMQSLTDTRGNDEKLITYGTGQANGGQSGTDKNMQPYITQLYIMKL